MMTRRTAVAAVALLALSPVVWAQTGGDLYPGEKALYEAATKEGLVVSFDTGPTWANWAAQFAAFKKRYPDVEMTYNDLGSAATVVALEKARNRPQADTAYYFAASAVDAAKKDVVESFKPVNFEKLPEVFRHPEGKWFTIHSLTVAFLVNTISDTDRARTNARTRSRACSYASVARSLSAWTPRCTFALSRS